MTTATASGVHIAQDTRDIEDSLTNDEQREIAIELQEVLAEIRRIESELKTMKAEAKAEIARSQETVERLLGTLAKGTRKRSVDVTVRYDEDNDLVVVTRVDNGEELERRQMCDAERQIPIEDLSNSNPSTNGAATDGEDEDTDAGDAPWDEDTAKED